MPSEPRAIFRRVLVGYTLFIATVLLAPVPTVASGVVGGTEGVLSAFGLPAVVTEPGRVEFVLNAAMFAPIANLAALARPRHPWANWVVYAFLASLAVETIQGLLLPARSAQFEDVVANALGAGVGAWCSTLVVPVLYDEPARRRSGVPPAGG